MRIETIRNLLTLLSLLLLGGSLWYFYAITVLLPRQGPTREEVQSRFRAWVSQGHERQPPEKRWDYGAAQQAWWRSFERANLIGALPKPEPEPQPIDEEETPPEPLPTPLSEIIGSLAGLIGGERPEDGGLVILRYRPEAGVTPPPELAAGGSAPGGMPVVADQVPSVAAGRPAPRGGARPAPPTPLRQDPSAHLMHTVRVGERLWAPYQEIVLVRVFAGDDGAGAMFRRPDGKGGSREEVFRMESEIQGLAGFAGEAAEGEGREDDAPMEGGPPAARAGASEWVDVGETSREVAPDRWMISRQDGGWFEENFDRAFAQELTLEPYTSPRGVRDPSTGRALRGLQVRDLGPNLRRFGVRAGDLLISVNGVPITSKAQLARTVREMYDNGTRTFTGRFLSGGQYTERSYTVPEGGR